MLNPRVTDLFQVEDAVLRGKIDRLLRLSITDPDNFADMTRLDAQNMAFHHVPDDVDDSVMLQLLTMISKHTNDNFERRIARCKRLVAAVGDASFKEPVDMERPAEVTGRVVGPPVFVSGGGRARAAAPSASEDEGDSSSSGDEKEEGWALCRFIRSFLHIPSVVRGEDASHYHELESEDSQSKPVPTAQASYAEQNRQRREQRKVIVWRRQLVQRN